MDEKRNARCGRGTPSPGFGSLLPDDAPDWLTREEWNACFFLGFDAYRREGVECGVCGQVAVGMVRLLEQDYRFARLQPTPSGGLEPSRPGPAPGEHGVSCGEIGEGTFDYVGRARQAVAWLRTRAPALPRAWLEELVGLYDRLHGGTAPLA